MTWDDPQISVVVVNYRAAEEVEGFVASLAGSELQPLEVIVVDNASGDDSVARLSGREDITVVASADNTGFGGGVNLGAAHAKGNLVLIANPDIRLRPDTLGVLLRALRRDAEVAVACPDLLEPPDPSYVGRDYVEPVAAMAGAAMLVDRFAFDLIGGFDDTIFLYAEDTDLCYRMWLSGRSVVKVWDAIGDHEAHGAGGGRQWSAEQVKNGLYVHLKLMPWPRTAQFAARMAAKTTLRLAQQRDPALVRAWTWNLVHLPATMRRRRHSLAGVPAARRRRLLALRRLHAQWQSRPEALPFSARGA
jgi:GT2 family glycosyltransferase